jgi:hypothetical protein
MEMQTKTRQTGKIYEAPAVWSTAGPRLWPLAAIIRPGDVEELVPHDVRISASSTIEQQARWEGFWTPETKAVSERFLKVYREVTELGGIVRRDFDEAYERNPVALMEGRTMIVVRSFCGHRTSYGECFRHVEFGGLCGLKVRV